MIKTILSRVDEAHKRSAPLLRRTPFQEAPALSELVGGRVLIKCENLQVTGSFKARGAINRLLALSDAEKKAPVVTASTGNHGAAVSYGLKKLGLSGIVFAPETASPTKIKNIRRFGAEVRIHGTDCAEAETHARAFARERGSVYVSPYNDLDVVVGQATTGSEMIEDAGGKLDAILVATGGGGLIGGIATVFKARSPETEIIGCVSHGAADMPASVAAGRIVQTPQFPSIADGVAGNIEFGAITYEICRDTVDRYVIVPENEILSALRFFIAEERMLIEGAAAVPIASLLREKALWKGKTVGVVLCGGNIGIEQLAEVVRYVG